MPNCFSKHVYDSCHEAGHTYQPSCTLASVGMFFNCFKYGVRIYTPLYVVSGLIGRRKMEYFLNKMLKEIFQSSLFIGFNGSFMVMFFCLLRKLLGHFNYYTVGFVPGFLCSLSAILVERKSRRGALAVYMLNQALDTTFNMFKENGYVSDVKYGEIIIFSAAISAIMFMFRSNNLPDGFIKTIFEKVFTRNEKVSQKSLRSRDIEHIKLSCRLAGNFFLIGYGVQATYNILSVLSHLFSKPAKLLVALTKMDNMKTGAFFGSFVGIYKIAEYILSIFKTFSLSTNAAVAGGMAGLSMLFMRSSYIALYALCKALELFYMNGIEKGLFPYIKHFDSILYAVCTAIMFHAAILQPLILRKTYWTFLLKLTGRRFEDINRSKWNVWGLHSSKIDEMVKSGSMKFL